MTGHNRIVVIVLFAKQITHIVDIHEYRQSDRIGNNIRYRKCIIDIIGRIRKNDFVSDTHFISYSNRIAGYDFILSRNRFYINIRIVIINSHNRNIQVKSVLLFFQRLNINRLSTLGRFLCRIFITVHILVFYIFTV